MYNVEKITQLEEFKGMKDTWNGLLNGGTRHRPYMQHEWFGMWMKYFLNGSDLMILVVKENGKVKAVVPMLKKSVTFKKIPTTKLELIGNIASPVRSLILEDPNEEERVLEAIFRYLGSCRDWSLLELSSLPCENVNIPSLKGLLRRQEFKFEEFFCFGNWYLDEINCTGDEYVKGRCSNISKNIKRYRRKLQDLGRLRFELIRDGDDRQLDEYMDSYYSVFEDSWKDWEVHPTFHRELAKLARDEGWLRLGFLFLDDVAIGTQLWLVANRTAYIVRLAYKEQFRKMIPGVILTAEMMTHVIDVDGVSEVDYLIGDEPYKKDWTPKRRERRGLMIFNKDLTGRLLAFLVKRAIPLSAEIRRRLLIRGVAGRFRREV